MFTAIVLQTFLLSVRFFHLKQTPLCFDPKVSLDRLFYSFADDFPANSANVESCPVENNDSPSYDETRPFPKLGALNGGLTQNVSSILHSPFAARRQPFNCSAYIPTPFQLWTIGDGRVVAGVHYNNTAEHLKSPRPVENVSTSGFSVSDNSAFVKYCGQPSRFDEVSFRLGRTSSSEAAAVLASFSNSECASLKK